MVFIYYYLVYDDLDGQSPTTHNIFEHIQSFIENDQNPEESGFNDFGTTFEDLLNSGEFEELFTETEEKLEEESIEILNDHTGFLGEKYDFKEVSFFLLWGDTSKKLRNDEYKSSLIYYNSFDKFSSLKLLSNKQFFQNYRWYLEQPFLLDENFLNMPLIYLLNNNYLNFVNWSYNALYLNFKDRIHCNLSPVDYFESTFYFLVDPEIQENLFDYKNKNNFFFIFIQNSVHINDWDDVQFLLMEPDLNDVYKIDLRSHYYIFDDIYSISLNFQQKQFYIFPSIKNYGLVNFFLNQNILLNSLKKCFYIKI